MNIRLRIALFFTILGWLALTISAMYFLEIGASEKVAPSIIQGLSDAPARLIVQCIYFLGGFTLLHWTSGWLLAWLARPLAQGLTRTDKEANQLVWLIFMIFLLILIQANQHQFPGSTMSFSTPPLLERFQQPLLVALGAIILIWLLIGLVNRLLAFRRFAMQRSRLATPALLASALLLITVTVAHAIWTSAPFPSDPKRPHIIIVGIDSWRLSSLPSHGGERGLMPFVESFLGQSIIFEDAITPLARSYPSWWTILDGQYPHEHGIRFNLSSSTPANAQARLPSALRSLGYYALFAMDERRFAPISKLHGFDQIVGPQTGAGDFLLGTLNDTPLTNFIINTKLGQWLFPFSHANRAIPITYRPETFDRRLAEALIKAPRQPVFLTVHYELPHWPYTWADGPVGLYRDRPGGASYTRYLETLNRVDKQVENLFTHLDELGILDNALVVLLSDHGEAFHFDPSARQRLVTEQPEERADGEPSDSSASSMVYGGHGTHIFSLTQHQVPLAFRDMHQSLGEPGVRAGRASLIDVAPTVLDFLNQDITSYSGLNLLPHLKQRGIRVPNRLIPLETGFSPPSLISGDPNQSRLIAEAAAYYRISTNGQLELKPEVQLTLFNRKQLGMLYDNWIFGHLSETHSTLYVYDIENRRTVSEMQLADWPSNHSEIVLKACLYIRSQRASGNLDCIQRTDASPIRF